MFLIIMKLYNYLKGVIGCVPQVEHASTRLSNESAYSQPSARRRDPFRAEDEGSGMSATCWHPSFFFFSHYVVQCPADGIRKPYTKGVDE